MVVLELSVDSCWEVNICRMYKTSQAVFACIWKLQLVTGIMQTLEAGWDVIHKQMVTHSLRRFHLKLMSNIAILYSREHKYISCCLMLLLHRNVMETFFFNIQLYKVHLKHYMNYLSQVGELAILSLVIKPTVQNKSFHSYFWICRLLYATIYNCFSAHMTDAMYNKPKYPSDFKYVGSDCVIFILFLWSKIFFKEMGNW